MNTLKEVSAYLWYVAGSLCFLIGSIISLTRAIFK